MPSLPTIGRISTLRFSALYVVVVTTLSSAPIEAFSQEPDAVNKQVHEAALLEKFEKEIRPALIEHCQDCHAVDTDASGGLLLDSRDGWAKGGDSGPAIIPGKSKESLAFRAITYDDPDLQMPPDGKLPKETIELFREWIDSGAADPRESMVEQTQQTGLPVERAQEHWSYRPIDPPAIPADKSPVDALIDSKLKQQQLVPTTATNPEVLVRRLYFDLTGLPPTPAQIDDFLEATSSDPANAFAGLVEELLASPAYGEHFARKWLDVARYAESITLRGFVLPEAWRYRDYIISSMNSDRSFQQMIREQLAGDLIVENDETLTIAERQKHLIATGFLALGNTNLERQDKTQLEMDFIDEQLEVIGRAFLGQTIGCARCHDHKFDPIPTKDYYALAGIFRSAEALDHDNVSKWIEKPIPLEPKDEEPWAKLREELATIEATLSKAKKLLRKKEKLAQLAVESLPGIVIDGDEANYVGNWRSSQSVEGFVGEDYRVAEGAAAATATYEPKSLEPGEYEVRISYTPFSNRTSKLIVRVFSAEGEKEIRLNQRKQSSDGAIWNSLGKFRFEKDGQAYVLLSNEGADGVVIADAVQFLPPGVSDVSSSKGDAGLSEQTQKLKAEVAAREAEKAKIDKALADYPMFLTIAERRKPQDIPIHIRGDVHNLGEVVPRGFLTAIEPRSPQQPSLDQTQSEKPMRLQFADWVASNDNPLTARVYANRVWLWLMGQGLVSTPNNFGTTGVAPSNAKLLDWLAKELIENDWSTKHLVRRIVGSEAYKRSIGGIAAVELFENNAKDPNNEFYWRGHRRRLPVEAIRDTMLFVSGELDGKMGGSLIRNRVKSDYDYVHTSTRRSVYHPVFRNSLPELFEAFDFANASVPVGQRPRSTVATQGLVLMNHPWVNDRAEHYANRLVEELELLRHWDNATLSELAENVYREALGRSPSQAESQLVLDFLTAKQSPAERLERLKQFVHSIFASIDFRYLE